MKFVSILVLLATCLTALAQTVVNDITRLNPVTVREVARPKSVAHIKELVKNHHGPISIGGGRFSMGGQTATENALQIDMRDFNRILDLDHRNRKITVQAGIRWRDIQNAIDKHDLSVKIMQTYSNFTVGGSLGVNVHGRYIGEGPLIRSVESIKLVLASGEEIKASRMENPEIFFAAIGGYGGLGIVTEATLHLVPNEKIRKQVEVLPTHEYKKFFFEKIRDNKNVVLQNGDIYPPDYEFVRSESWHRTDRPLTIETRLIPEGKKYWLEPNVISIISALPFGSELRSRILDPILDRKEVVVWRNFEASYDVAQLEPSTPRLLFTYVLQEYFVPVAGFDEFIPKMRSVFKRHDANIINVSIRHALPDDGSLLAWAPEEVFSFVVYYKQGTSPSAQAKVAQWTRELIDEALSVGGRYYLPYQIHATKEQFQRAYPGSQRFFEVKKKLDPTNKFRNKLWDQYYQ